VEIDAALSAAKPVVFVCVAVSIEGEHAVLRRGKGAAEMLRNFSFMVDVQRAECAVEADKKRELALVDATKVNKQVRQALVAAMATVQENVSELDAYQCGEPEALAAVPAERREAVLEAASAAGLVAVVYELAGQVNLQGVCYPLFIAASNGHLEVVHALLEAKAKVDQADNDGWTPLFMAAQKGHLEVVRALLEANAEVDKADNDGVTSLFMAAQNGHLEVVHALLEAKAEVDQAHNDGWTPLCVAAQNGHLEVVHALLEAKAEVDQASNSGWSPLFVAAWAGHLATVAFLLERGADSLKVSTVAWRGAEAGTAPAEVAEAQGHIEVAALLRK
jgi:hypothetical protein